MVTPGTLLLPNRKRLFLVFFLEPFKINESQIVEHVRWILEHRDRRRRPFDPWLPNSVLKSKKKKKGKRNTGKKSRDASKPFTLRRNADRETFQLEFWNNALINDFRRRLPTACGTGRR